MTRPRDYAHGLVVGKFYPPHAGHALLIETALGRCDAVTVAVAGGSRESIPIDDRVAWLAASHPRAQVRGAIDDHPIDYDDPGAWDAHMAIFRSLCRRPVDAVFTSESYGPELARRFGAAHVAVDPNRARVPISATAIRADPARHWPLIDPGARAWLCRRVVVLGAESTGTTTLARALADRYETTWVPEHGRRVTEQRVRDGAAMDAIAWSDEDFLAIAQRQQADEDAAARCSGPVLICDTDALATCVWQERYLGRSTPTVERVAAGRRPSLYVLTGEDIPFVQDGVRDGEHVRFAMNERFRERLSARRVPWLEVRGAHRERLEAASARIDSLLEAGWALRPPNGPAVESRA